MFKLTDISFKIILFLAAILILCSNGQPTGQENLESIMQDNKTLIAPQDPPNRVFSIFPSGCPKDTVPTKQGKCRKIAGIA